MNQELMKKRSLKAVRPSDQIESEYRSYMQALVKEMANEVKVGLLPIIKRNKSSYVKDSWADDVTSFFDVFRAKWSSFLFRNKVRTDIQRPLSMVESNTTAQFLKNMNKAVGVDVSGMLKSEGIEAVMTSALQENVTLVTSLPDEYLKRIESIVYSGMQQGRYPTAIAKDLQEATGISWRRAKLIARDQVAKINSAVDSERSQNLGIEYYRWSTSNDRRVSGDPSGKYPKAKVKCYMISKADIGFGQGVYTYKHGADYAGESNLHPGASHINCRCRRIPLIEGVNWERPKK
ncbi:head morphogenesis domain protein [Vibrio phage 1.112.O._10N.286.46.B11]|nr:head morphogenesis domain protein [Vibrio phage 1.112.O._10N.286.46.B11]